VFRRPLGLAEAIDLVEALIEAFDIAVMDEARAWWVDLMQVAGRLRGNEVFDARIALCLRYNGVKRIATHDADFSKYAFLKVIQI